MIAYSNLANADNPSDDDLVIRNIGLVKRIAYHLSARLPSSVDVDDLMQSGMVGLLEAATNFDPGRGASFETYAGIRIRGAMLDDIRKQDWTPRSVHHKYRRLSNAVHEVEAETGCAAEPSQVANKLGIPIEEYHQILTDSASSRLFSLDETLDESVLHRSLPAAKTPTPDEELFRSQFREKLASAVEKLPEREKLVLSLYYERELNLKEIGKVLDVSESRVCQIHAQAVMRLRATAERW